VESPGCEAAAKGQKIASKEAPMARLLSSDTVVGVVVVGAHGPVVVQYYDLTTSVTVVDSISLETSAASPVIWPV